MPTFRSHAFGPASRRQRVVLAALLAVVITSCTPEEPVLVPPVIASFTADPAVVEAGASVTLAWEVEGATALVLQPGNVVVTGLTSATVSPTANITYTLIATNRSGQVNRQVEVRLGEPPTITAFVADPSATTAGSAVTLSWVTAGATSLTLDPAGIDVLGSDDTVVYPDVTTTYTLTAGNSFGDVQRQVEVRVGPAPVINGFGPASALVNPGLPVTLQWSLGSAAELWLLGPGLDGGLDVTGTSSFLVPAVPADATYTLVASNAFGVVEAEAAASRAVPAVSLLIAGQSNAVGWNVPGSQAGSFITAAAGVAMLGNDYVWKPAYEPTDDCVGQVDAVSHDNCLAGVSFGVSTGNRTGAATGGEVFLIPAAKGASSALQWAPAADVFDRETLFGSAAHRSRLAEVERGAPLGHQWAGASYGAVLWYQGESDSSSLSLTNTFQSRTDNVFDAFQAELGAPIIFMQLARRGPTNANPDPTVRNLLYQRVRETQRRLETGARELNGAPSSAAEAGRFLVVTHDLPFHPDDGRHLSAQAQLELGRRISLAIRQHLLGEDVDGSGPRLVAVEFPNSTQVRVRMDRPITQPARTDALAYAGYFELFSGGGALAVNSIVRHPSDSASVLITLQEAAPGSVQVRYMPPPGIPTHVETDVIRSASCSEPMPGTSLCLPLPAFGIAADGVELSSMQVYSTTEID